MSAYAFPSGHDPKTGTAQFGMNLRDYFAAKAMSAMIMSGKLPTGIMIDTCEEAYLIADHMMKAREL